MISFSQMPIRTVYTISKLRMKAPFYFKFIMVVCFALLWTTHGHGAVNDSRSPSTSGDFARFLKDQRSGGQEAFDLFGDHFPSARPRVTD